MKISIDAIPESWLRTMRMIEFIGVLVAIAVVLFDFIVERPTDRIIRAWVVIAQSPGAEGNIGQSAALTVLNDAGQDIRGVNLRDAWLVEANLRGFKLTAADLTGAELMDSNLAGADLKKANLKDAFLWDANLTGASLIRANLTGADLANANLTNAKLIRADLTGANFENANHLTQGQLDSACVSSGGQPPTLPEGLVPPKRVCARGIRRLGHGFD